MYLHLNSNYDRKRGNCYELNRVEDKEHFRAFVRASAALTILYPECSNIIRFNTLHPFLHFYCVADYQHFIARCSDFIKKYGVQLPDDLDELDLFNIIFEIEL